MTRILIKRKPHEPFICPKCGALMVHDEAYKHWGQQCPKRKLPVPRE